VSEYSVLIEKLDGVTQRLDSRLKDVTQRLDDRMDRFEKQQDSDRLELQNIIGQISGIAATCKLHVEQTNSAVSAASTAIKISEEAKATSKQIESSWHDLRKMSRPGTSEHMAVTNALEARGLRKEKDIEATVSNIVLDVFAKRDQVEREFRKEQADLLFKKNENKRREDEAKRKRISWIIYTIITIIGALSSMGFWNLYSEARSEKRAIMRILHKESKHGHKHTATTTPLD
jgi:hypothetical protein